MRQFSYEVGAAPKHFYLTDVAASRARCVSSGAPPERFGEAGFEGLVVFVTPSADDERGGIVRTSNVEAAKFTKSPSRRIGRTSG